MKYKQIVHDLPNEEYHRGQEYAMFLSSTQLKDYIDSPEEARYKREHPEQNTMTPNMILGDLFHYAMECIVKSKTTDCECWLEKVAVFSPPINERTGQPYGDQTDRYRAAYARFLANSGGLKIATPSDIEKVKRMTAKLLDKNGKNYEWLYSRITHGTAELSFFTEYLNQYFKVRTDLITSNVIVDWKTISNLTLKDIDSAIQKFHYDVSAAFYLFFLHEITGKWFRFYWVFVETKPPFKNIIVDSVNYTYYEDDEGIISEGVGAQLFRKLLDEHIKCSETGIYPGPESLVPEDNNGNSIYTPVPPAFYNTNFQFYE